MNFLKPKIIIPLALVAGSIATWGAFRVLQAEKESVEVEEKETRNVVVAASNLTVGTVLNNENMLTLEYPVELAPVSSYGDIELLKTRVLKTEIYEGEPILTAKLAPEGSMGGFSSLIPPGMRAMTVPVNVVSGVGGFILPKTRVDVLVTASPSIKKEEATTKIILENVEVMAIDQVVAKVNSDPVTVKSVTLLVTPEQSGKLALAMNEGTLQLSLRNVADDKDSGEESIILKELFAGKKVEPKPVKRRTYNAPTKKEEPKEPQKRIIEVIRSNERSEVSFDEK